MEIRIFQVLIPLIAVVFCLGIFIKVRRDKTLLKQSVPGIIFWLGATLLSLFPDKISNVVAHIFGIKDNINAIIFLSLGLLFYIQYNLFVSMKKIDKNVTFLIRKMALKEEETKDSV